MAYNRSATANRWWGSLLADTCCVLNGASPLIEFSSPLQTSHSDGTANWLVGGVFAQSIDAPSLATVNTESKIELPSIAPPLQLKETPVALLIAHRGASNEAPENTYSAFERAIELGADLIEFDVQLSKDGVPIVHHDMHLTRTTDLENEKSVNQLTRQELHQLDAGSWFSDKHKGEKIPTLAEVLALPLKGVGLYIELKPRDASPQDLVDAVLLELERSEKAKGELPFFVLASFKTEVLELIKQRNPDYPLLGIAQSNEEVEAHLAAGVDWIGLNTELATPQAFEKMKQLGIPIWVWTIDDPEVVHTMLEQGAQGIVSNDPRGVKPTIHKFKNGPASEGNLKQ